MKRLSLSIVVLGLAALPSGAALKEFAGTPGYLDLGDLRQFETGNAVTEVIVPQSLIRMVSAVVRKEEPEFGAMLKQLDLVHVHTIEFDEDAGSGIRDHMDTLSARLDEDGWDPLVRMREGDDQNHVYLFPDAEDGVRGLCVLALDGSEAIFVNIVGTIDLEMLSRLGDQFDLPGLDAVEAASEADSGDNREPEPEHPDPAADDAATPAPEDAP